MKRNLPTSEQYLKDLKQINKQVKRTHETFNFDESVLPPDLENWLAKLTLLYGVPFEHMVSNAGLLPLESLRFFFVDPNWISSLVDGALSVGAQSSRDISVIEPIYERLQQSLKVNQQTVRRRLAGAEIQTELSTDITVSGLLIRSQIVSGWPGLEVLAYENYTIGEHEEVIPNGKIENMRIERLAPDVMLCLFAKTPKLVQFNEPKEGLSFGVRSDGKLVPRFLGYKTGQPCGQFVTGSPKPEDEAEISKRNGNKGVIDVMKTRDNLITILNRYDALNKNTLSPADFGIQLIKSAEQQSFISEIETETNI
jgi:hypothetical protein